MTTVLLVAAVLVAVLLLSVLIELRKGGGSGRKDDPTAVSAVITSMSERLTAIQEGVGAMKVLAEDFRGFEALIRDVNSRGAWGEVQLRQILEEVLAHGQWEENVETIPGTGKRVEFAIKFPGMNDQELVWMPVDSKFPLADYQRLLEAQKAGDADKAEEARKAL
ncbi:MAG: DNA recombination protein RmuC, partial [Dehalococcoidia bacterium]|nr:DNA recombination protein RmuC [Dehalococcoidia bacterium]